MARKKGLTNQQIASLFEDSDEEGDNLNNLFSKQEQEEANQEQADSDTTGGTWDEKNLDLDFELDDDDNEDIRDSEYQKSNLDSKCFSEDSRSGVHFISNFCF